MIKFILLNLYERNQPYLVDASKVIDFVEMPKVIDKDGNEWRARTVVRIQGIADAVMVNQSVECIMNLLSYPKYKVSKS